MEHIIIPQKNNLSKAELLKLWIKSDIMHIEDDPKKPTFEVGDKVMLLQDSDTVWIITKVHTEGGAARYDIRPDAPKPLKQVPQDELTTSV